MLNIKYFDIPTKIKYSTESLDVKINTGCGTHNQMVYVTAHTPLSREVFPHCCYLIYSHSIFIKYACLFIKF